jgi:hypothetical protein
MTFDKKHDLLIAMQTAFSVALPKNQDLLGFLSHYQPSAVRSCITDSHWGFVKSWEGPSETRWKKIVLLCETKRQNLAVVVAWSTIFMSSLNQM